MVNALFCAIACAATTRMDSLRLCNGRFQSAGRARAARSRRRGCAKNRVSSPERHPPNHAPILQGDITMTEALRRKLTNAGRVLASQDQGDFVAGHVTARLPDDPGRFLMKPAT